MKELIVGDVMQEWAGTRRVLERLPEEHFAWKPHEKSMTLAELATHTVNLLNWQLAIMREPEFDLASVPLRREAASSRAALLDEFDTASQEIESWMDKCDVESLSADWTLRRGEHTIRTEPRANALRSFILSHMIHHRAQLTVYLRLLDVPVPGLYGPTADDRV